MNGAKAYTAQNVLLWQAAYTVEGIRDWLFRAEKLR